MVLVEQESVDVANGAGWEKLGGIVESRREALGLTKTEAAKRAGVSLSMWRLVESGRYSAATNPTLMKMAGALGIDPPALLEVVGRRSGAEETVDYMESLAAVLDTIPLTEAQRSLLVSLVRELTDKG